MMCADLGAGNYRALEWSQIRLGVDEYTDGYRQIHSLMESAPDIGVSDLHVWQMSSRSCGCILSLVSHTPKRVSFYKERLVQVQSPDYLTIEINPCPPDLYPAAGAGT